MRSPIARSRPAPPGPGARRFLPHHPALEPPPVTWSVHHTPAAPLTLLLLLLLPRGKPRHARGTPRSPPVLPAALAASLPPHPHLRSPPLIHPAPSAVTPLLRSLLLTRPTRTRPPRLPPTSVAPTRNPAAPAALASSSSFSTTPAPEIPRYCSHLITPHHTHPPRGTPALSIYRGYPPTHHQHCTRGSNPSATKPPHPFLPQLTPRCPRPRNLPHLFFPITRRVNHHPPPNSRGSTTTFRC